MTNRDNFQSWFADYIRSLGKDRNGGFLITIVSFPLFGTVFGANTDSLSGHMGHRSCRLSGTGP
jgi:hypothetical protein